MELVKNSKEYVRGAFWLSLSAIILKVIGLVFKIPLSYMLGDEGMGYFNSAYTIYTAFYIIGSAGIPKAISILTVKAESTGEDSGAIFRVSFRAFSLIGLILTLILIVFAENFSIFCTNRNSVYALIAISPSVFFVCASGVLRGALNGKMKFLPIAVSEIIAGVFKLGVGLIFANYAITRAYSVEVVAAFAILGITLGSLFSLVYLFFSYLHINKENKSKPLTYKRILKEVFRISIPITMVSAISSILNILDLTVIMSGLEKSGYSELVSTVLYGNYTTLAVPMFTLVVTVITPFSTAALPAMTSLYSNRDLGELSKVINRTMKMTVFFTIPSFFALLFFSKEILSLIFERSSAVLGFVLLSVLAVSVLFVGPLTVINTVLESMGRVKTTLFSLSVGGIAKLIVTLCLVYKFNFGIMSAPVGTAISYALSLIISSFMLFNVKGLKFELFNSSLVPFIASFAALMTVNGVGKFLFGDFAVSLYSFAILAFFGICYLIFFVFLQFFLTRELKIRQNAQKT